MNAVEFESHIDAILRPGSAFRAALSTSVRWGLRAVFVLACWMSWKGISRIPEHYKAIGRLECQQATTSATAKAVSQQAAGVITDAASAVSHAQATGTSAERSRNRITTYFHRLNEEARHAPPAPSDACVLSPDRLRLWTAANSGDGREASAPAESSAASQPHDSTGPAASTGLWPHAGPGGEPSGRRPGLSPAGQQVLPPAQVPGDRP